MLLKSVALISVLAVIAQSVPATVKVLPFVDSSLPVKFRQVIAEAAPRVPSNLASYAFGVDLSVPTSLSQLQCVKQAGYSAVFVRAYNPSGQGSFDQNACSTIQNAYNAGLGTEIYMTPQPSSSKQGYQQLDEIYQGLTQVGITVRSIWIQVTSPTNWPSNANNNVNFINSIVSRARQYGMTVGIYTSYYDWNQITNGWSSIGNDVLLWYWNVLGGGVNGETPANFADFRAFGCWTVPSVKQFAQVEQVCQLTVNRDVYAAGTMLKAADAVQEDGKMYTGGFISGNQ
uniref:Glycoside hydrolase family 25 protein n=1 Tax=Caenorhabditis tropicalis TaxID=1561998 RepID=A0A1I7TSM8_9PELO